MIPKQASNGDDDEREKERERERQNMNGMSVGNWLLVVWLVG